MVVHWVKPQALAPIVTAKKRKERPAPRAYIDLIKMGQPDEKVSKRRQSVKGTKPAARAIARTASIAVPEAVGADVLSRESTESESAVPCTSSEDGSTVGVDEDSDEDNDNEALIASVLVDCACSARLARPEALEPEVKMAQIQDLESHDSTAPSAVPSTPATVTAPSTLPSLAAFDAHVQSVLQAFAVQRMQLIAKHEALAAPLALERQMQYALQLQQIQQQVQRLSLPQLLQLQQLQQQLLQPPLQQQVAGAGV